MIELHQCEFIRVGQGIPFALEEYDRAIAEGFDTEEQLKYSEIIRVTILKPCHEDCEGPDILFCPDCRSVKKL